MRKAVVAVYDSHEKAVKAITLLVDNEIPENELSIVGHGEIVEDHIHIVKVKDKKLLPAFIGAGLGLFLGALVGLDAIVLSGLGFLQSAGVLEGALGGCAIGMIVGGIISFVVSLLYRKDDMVLFKSHLNNGEYLVVVKAEEDDIVKAKKILHTENIHEELYEIHVR